MKERTEKHNRTRGSWRRRRAEEGPFIQKRLSFTYERKKKKEQKKSSFSPPGRSVKPNQCLVWHCCSSPRHRLTMEASLGRHTSHFQSASSGTGLRARGPHGGTTIPLKCLNSHKKKKKKSSVLRIGLTSKSENNSTQVAFDQSVLIWTANISFYCE